jgi:1-aminocyclopropane-1-carboxylate deaminase/D-cysteine desulfhydrase-like pyridoxal-dependent ACC family enzyme
VRVAVAAARRLGLDPIVQLEERVPTDDVVYHASGNVLLDRLFGARIVSYPEGEDEPAADRALRALAATLEREGRRPFVVALAEDQPPLGALGYMDAAAELTHQAREADLAFGAVVTGSGGGNTHAGLLVGLRLLGWPGEVHGMCVRRDARSQHGRILRKCSLLADLVGVDAGVGEADVIVGDEAFGEGYGRVSEPVREALVLAARTEGLVLDPVYTGKALAGLIARIRAGCYPREERICFLHTGGQPALFAYRELLGDLG